MSLSQTQKEMVINGEGDSSPITVVLSRRVKLGKEKDFEVLLQAIAKEALKFPGHQGVSILRPEPGAKPIYTIVMHFRSKEELEAWTNSSTRANLLAQVEALCESALQVQQISALEGWFQMPGSPIIIPPKRYKTAVVSWIAIVPLLLLFNIVIVPSLPPLLLLPFVVRLLIVAAITILLMTYFVMPQMTRLFRPWLYPKSRS